MRVYKSNLRTLQREIATFKSLLGTCSESQVHQVYNALMGLRTEYIELLEKRQVKVERRVER